MPQQLIVSALERSTKSAAASASARTSCGVFGSAGRRLPSGGCGACRLSGLPTSIACASSPGTLAALHRGPNPQIFARRAKASRKDVLAVLAEGGIDRVYAYLETFFIRAFIECRAAVTAMSMLDA